MIDFNREPTPKSKEEREFETLNEKYEEKFGVSYVFNVGMDVGGWSETLADIKRRIAEDDPQPEPDYKEGLVY